MQDPVIGRVIGNYRVLGPLGEGGMAKVYRAEHSTIGKEAALKLLNPEYSRREQSVARFFHEAQAVNRIRHENLVDVFDFGKTPEGDHFILMELLHGEPLTESLASKKPMPVERIIRIGIQICHALEATHQKGIVHRDLKDANVFLTTRAGQKDFVKILDFGIAKLLDGTAPDLAKTKSGAMIGTPLYISPEQARGIPVGPASDIYAFGCLLFVMATGEPPFMDENAVAVALKHIDEPPPRPRDKNPEIPEKLEEIMLRCLEKAPEARYPSMLAVARELESFTKGNNHTTLELTEKIPKRRTNNSKRNVIIGGAIAGLVLTIGGYLLFAGADSKQEITGSNPGLTNFGDGKPLETAASAPTSKATPEPATQIATQTPPVTEKTSPKKTDKKPKDEPVAKADPEKKVEPPKTETPPDKNKTDTKIGGWTVDPFTGQKIPKP